MREPSREKASERCECNEGRSGRWITVTEERHERQKEKAWVLNLHVWAPVILGHEVKVEVESGGGEEGGGRDGRRGGGRD
jgi:hypothetical protein